MSEAGISKEKLFSNPRPQDFTVLCLAFILLMSLAL